MNDLGTNFLPRQSVVDESLLCTWVAENLVSASAKFEVKSQGGSLGSV